MSQHRISLPLALAGVATAITLALPGTASAAYEHPANNEQGVTVHPDHFVSQKTRAQVKAETEAALKQGGLSFGESSFPREIPSSGSSKTREQVIQELRDESPSAREARLRSISG